MPGLSIWADDVERAAGGAACPHPPCPSGAAPAPCQRYYSIPLDYLKEEKNGLTVLE